MRAWKEFSCGKHKKKDVVLFELELENNLFRLHKELTSKTYKHREYFDFYVSDPKRRHIHKATVGDRVVHQAIFRILYNVFDKHFIYHSYSSRKFHGTHLAVNNFYKACGKASKNWKLKIFVLKCDIRKFFDSIDHELLKGIIKTKISCRDTLCLLGTLLQSFEKNENKGLPLGNVTSQLFANIYLNEFDQFIKHKLKIKYYFRYCDDFVIISESEEYLFGLILEIKKFLSEKLLLDLHPKKLEIRPVRKGIDFLGYVVLPHIIVLRTKTKKRILKSVKNNYKKYKNGLIDKEDFINILNSYFGILSHCRNKRIYNYIKRFI